MRFQLNKDFEIRVFVDLMIFSLAPKALMLSGPLTGHISGFEAGIQPWGEGWLGVFGGRNLIPSLKLTAKAPENRPKPNRKVVFQPFIFRGYVSSREGKWKIFFFVTRDLVPQHDWSLAMDGL